MGSFSYVYKSTAQQYMNKSIFCPNALDLPSIGKGFSAKTQVP